MGVNAVHWFRKGLRLHDNPALKECIQGANTIRCVYILDPWFAGSSNVGINRWRQHLNMHKSQFYKNKKTNRGRKPTLEYVLLL